MARPTISDIAKQAGVSKATVSRVLNNRPQGVGGPTRERIRKIMDDTGFHPSALARGLTTGQSRSVGLIIPDIANPFYPLLVSGAERALSAAGYSLFLCHSAGDVAKEGEAIRVLIEKGVDGVILDSAGSQSDAQVRTLEKAGIPVVLLDRVIGKRSSRYGVFLDNQLGARQAALHLLAREACRLIYINGPARLSQSVERRSGVEAALRDSGVAADRLRIVAGDFTLESGRCLTASLIEAQRAAGADRRLAFNAIFAANDLMAIGALRALRQAGVAVPEEVEVIGFDDIEFARMTEPPLTTVAQPAQEMGAISAELLLRLVAGRRPRRKTVLTTPRLVLRGTTVARSASAPSRSLAGDRNHGKL
jgi:LacI family transcriptional regulator